MAALTPTHSYTLPYRSRSGTVAGTELLRFGEEIPTPSVAVSIPPTGGFPVSIDGRNYMVDTSFEPYRREAFKHKSIPPQRQSLHFTNNPDDGTISTEGLWRRETRDWSLGAGQIYFDRKKSDEARFYRSKGVDPWTQWQLQLLPDTKVQYTAANSTNVVKAIRVGNYVYWQDGNTIRFTSYWPNQIGITQSVGPVGSGTTTFSVKSTAGWPASGSLFYIIIDSEVMLVSSWSYNSGLGYYDITVVRGQQNTGVVGHTNTTVTPYTALATGITGTILDFVTDGYNVWVLTTAGLFNTIVGNTDGCAKLTSWTLTPLVGTSLTGVLAWAGGRLIMALNNIQSLGSSSVMTVPTGSSVFDLTSAKQGTAVAKIVGYLAANINSSQTSITVDYLQSALGTGAYVQIEGEIIKVGSSPNMGATSLGTVTRGQLSTIAAAHNAGTPIYSINSTSAAVPNFAGVQPVEAGLLYTHPNLQWKWTGIAGGSSQIYFAGHPDDTEDPGLVYRSTLTSGTASSTTAVAVSGGLTIPVVALPMPAGEYPTAIRNYLNYIFVGTNKGIRMCETLNALDPTGNTGDLKSGPLIPNITQPVSSPVTAIMGYDRYVYFAWNNYDSTSSGLGRMDLTSFIDTQAPAYASDLMISGQGTVTWLDFDPINNSPLISFDPISGNAAIYTADLDNCVEEGQVDSGLITYGIPDFKNAVSIDANIENISGSTSSSVAFEVAVDNGAALSIGSYSGLAAKTTLPFPTQQFGEQYRIYTDLYPATDANGNYVSPTLNRWTLKALPGIPSGITIMAVLLFYEPFDMDGTMVYQDPYVEYKYLELLRQQQKVVTYVEGSWSASVTVDLIEWLPERRRPTVQGGYHGDLVVTLKTITG